MADSSEPPVPPVTAAEGPSRVDLTLRSTKVIRTVVFVCVAIEVLLVVLDYHVNYGGLTDLGTIRRLTNITREDSLASWVGTTQTTLIAANLWLLYTVVRQVTTARWRRTGWLVMAAFFTLMAVDDGALLHERAGTAFSELYSTDSAEGPPTALGARMLDTFPSYAWQIVALPVFALLGLFVLVFLWGELPARQTRVLVVVALACFVTAVGLDFLEGLDEDHRWNLYATIDRAFDFGDYTEYRFGHTPYDTLRHFSKSIEEFLEMLGNTLLWYVFLRTLVRLGADLRIRFV